MSRVDSPNDPAREIVGNGCCCSRCLADVGAEVWWMVVCQKCGNKRCPHAADHRNDCTSSNEPGQPGSNYAKGT